MGFDREVFWRFDKKMSWRMKEHLATSYLHFSLFSLILVVVGKFTKKELLLGLPRWH